MFFSLLGILTALLWDLFTLHKREFLPKLHPEPLCFLQPSTLWINNKNKNKNFPIFWVYIEGFIFCGAFTLQICIYVSSIQQVVLLLYLGDEVDVPITSPIDNTIKIDRTKLIFVINIVVGTNFIPLFLV